MNLDGRDQWYTMDFTDRQLDIMNVFRGRGSATVRETKEELGAVLADGDA